MLNILQARLQQYISCELPDVQAVFRNSRGTKDQIANIRWIIEKARGFQKKHLLLLHWLHETLWLCGSWPFSGGKEPACKCRRSKIQSLNPWVGKIPWSRKWQSTPLLLPGEFHGQRSLAGYSPQGHKDQTCLKQLRTDSIDHNTLRKILKELGIPEHFTFLLKNLYTGQEATIWAREGTTDWFKIGKELWQGCILSPCLFNLYAEYICDMLGWMKLKL